MACEGGRGFSMYINFCFIPPKITQFILCLLNEVLIQACYIPIEVPVKKILTSACTITTADEDRHKAQSLRDVASVHLVQARTFNW